MSKLVLIDRKDEQKLRQNICAHKAPREGAKNNPVLPKILLSDVVASQNLCKSDIIYNRAHFKSKSSVNNQQNSINNMLTSLNKVEKATIPDIKAPLPLNLSKKEQRHNSVVQKLNFSVSKTPKNSQKRSTIASMKSSTKKPKHLLKIESTLKNRQNLLPPRNSMKGPRINLKIAQTSARSGMESSPFVRAKEYDKSLTRKAKLPGLSPSPKVASSKPLVDNLKKNLNRIKYLEKAHRYVRRRNILSQKSHSKRVKIKPERGTPECGNVSRIWNNQEQVRIRIVGDYGLPLLIRRKRLLKSTNI
ncbi:unnamed protein product [Moneuplotes crassus]|uniref:Uncharacterized protein n=1 Tax=Euplotes crassus TaxID=5936 RepID=A0AAD1UT94_EUPCR|nr:unnamed protein product [Moneuplotes crassus]